MKDTLYRFCVNMLEQKQGQLKKELQALKESADSDTKSSMGDKYETSREMINLEKGKIAEQLTHTEKMLLSMKSIDVDKPSSKGELGALVTTNNATYYIAVSLGKVEIEGKDVFVLSPMSPVGRNMLDRHVGDEIKFGTRSSRIESII